MNQVEKPQQSLALQEAVNLTALQNFQKSLNRQPDRRFIKSQRVDGKDVPYLVQSHIENLLRRFYFGLYQIEIVSYAMLVNEVTVHARVKVFHPILRQWLNYDGIASVPVQQDKDSQVSQFMNTKKVKALQKNLPAAYAIAIKNAVKKIGKIFGSDLGRTDEDVYVPFDIDSALNESSKTEKP